MEKSFSEKEICQGGGGTNRISSNFNIPYGVQYYLNPALYLLALYLLTLSAGPPWRSPLLVI